MIGSFMVYQGILRDHFVVREVIGETDCFWVMRNCQNHDEHRAKKSAIGPHVIVSSEGAAKKVASQITNKFTKARDHYQNRRQQITDELLSLAQKEGE